MKRHFILLFLLFGITQSLLAKAEDKTLSISFFAQPLTLQYDASIEEIVLPNQMGEAAFHKFYQHLHNQSSYFGILMNLFHYKKEMALNDWMYYMLINECGKEIFSDKGKNYQTLFSWFILQKSGYKTQLSYEGNDAMLSVFTKDKVYDMPFMAVKVGRVNGYFVDITTYSHRGWDMELVRSGIKRMTSNYMVAENTKPFTFNFTELPIFDQPQIVTKRFSFIHDNKEENILVSINKSYVQMMYKYPELSVPDHVNIGLSPQAYNTLVIPLKKRVEGMNNYDAIRYLLSFTRQAMQYKTDKEAYNLENVSFSSEETLFYKYSDCEDRSILFKYLVNEILGLQSIILDFEEHASVAVALDKTYGPKPVLHKGKYYTICDPTGPANIYKPGDYPTGLIQKSFEIAE